MIAVIYFINKIILINCCLFLCICEANGFISDIKETVIFSGLKRGTINLEITWKITTSVKNPASTLQYKKQEDSEFQLSHTFIDYVNRFSLQVKHGESYTFFINGSFTVAGNIEKEFSDPKSIDIYYLQSADVQSLSQSSILVMCKMANSTFPTACQITLRSNDGEIVRIFMTVSDSDSNIASGTIIGLPSGSYTSELRAVRQSDQLDLDGNFTIINIVDLLETESKDGLFSVFFIVVIALSILLLPLILFLVILVLQHFSKRCCIGNRGSYMDTVDKLDAVVLYSAKDGTLYRKTSLKEDLNIRKKSNEDGLQVHSISSLSIGQRLMSSLPTFSSSGNISKHNTSADMSKRDSLDSRKGSIRRKLSLKGSFPFFSFTENENASPNRLTKSFSLDGALNANDMFARPLTKRNTSDALSLSSVSDDDMSLRTSLYNILDAFETGVISMPRISSKEFPLQSSEGSLNETKC